MTDFNYGMANRELMKDPAVVEEFDRLIARLKGFLRGVGQSDVESDLDNGQDAPPGTTTTTTVQKGKWVQAIKAIDLNADATTLTAGDSAVLRITPTNANRLIHGIGETINGMRLTIYVPASAAYTLTLKHESASATAPHRLSLVGQQDIETVVGEARAYDLVYDGITSRWVQLGGSSAIAAAVPSVAFVGSTQVGTDAGTSEKDLVTATLAANALPANGDVLVIRAFGNFANDANGKQLRFYWNGVAINATGAQAWQDRGWQLHVVIIRTSATAQTMHAQFIPAIAGTSASIGEFATGAATMSGTVAIKITGQNSNAVANEITFEGWYGFVIRGG